MGVRRIIIIISSNSIIINNNNGDKRQHNLSVSWVSFKIKEGRKIVSTSWDNLRRWR